MLNYYDILGVQQNATKKQLEAACKLLTPTKISYEISRTLLDDNERVKYNRHLNGDVSIPQTSVNWKSYKWWDTNYQGIVEKVVNSKAKRTASAFTSFLYIFASFASIVLLANTPDNLALSAILQVAFCVMWFARRHRKPSAAAIVIISLWNALLLTWIWTSAIVLFDYKIALSIVSVSVIFLGFRMNTLSHISSLGRSKIKLHVRIPDKHILGNYHWGMAGNLQDAVGKFGYENVFKGETGEKYTEELLKNFESIPGVRVFHGLRFPGSHNADVDHAIISGNNLIFIDSKQWSSGEYFWKDPDTINQKMSNGKIQLRETSFHVAVDRYKALLPQKLNIYAVIMIHGKGIKINYSPIHNGVALLDTEDGIGTIGQVLNDGFDNGVIDTTVVNSLANSLK